MKISTACLFSLLVSVPTVVYGAGKGKGKGSSSKGGGIRTPQPTSAPTPAPVTAAPVTPAPSTASPTPRMDLPLDRVANLNMPVDAFPLSRCQGDCTTFSDCEGDLICFERGCKNPGNTVPGCTGTPGSKFTDFCIDTIDLTPGELVFLGTPPTHPASVFPLQKCQGHCRFNDDCSGTLACFQRSFNQDVTIPGCAGVLAEDDTNYCYDVADA